MRYPIRQPYRYKSCLVGVEKTRVSDLETILPISAIKEYMAVDDDNNAVDSLITSLRAGAFDDVEKYLQRTLGENNMIVNYCSISESELLPFAYADVINSIQVDGNALDVSLYDIFSGRIEFTNKLGYQGNITISYNAKGQISENVLTVIKRLIWIDYDNQDSQEKHNIMKMLRAEKILGWI